MPYAVPRKPVGIMQEVRDAPKRKPKARSIIFPILFRVPGWMWIMGVTLWSQIPMLGRAFNNKPPELPNCCAERLLSIASFARMAISEEGERIVKDSGGKCNVTQRVTVPH